MKRIASIAAILITMTALLAPALTQAVFAEEHFFDKKFAPELYDDILRTVDGEKRSIILMGMPGCGKSTLGKALQRITGRTLYEMDELIEAEAGCTIPEIFANQGEKAFRDIESTVLQRVCREGGSIISLGGGAVLREENRAAIAQNGFVINIERDIAKSFSTLLLMHLEI